MSQMGQFSNLNALIETLTGNIGGPIGPTGANVNIVGAGGLVVTGNPATSTLTISGGGGGGVAVSFGTDVGGPAVPDGAGLISFINGSNISTNGATANQVRVNLVNSPSVSGSVTAGTGFVATTGDVTVTAGNINMANANAAGTQGIYKYNGNQWLHNLGISNVFHGTGTGNLTLNTGAVAATTIIGDLAAQALTTGASNSSLGYGTLQKLTSGSGNIAIGSNTLQNALTGNGNIAIGTGAGFALVAAESDNIYIGNAGVAAESAHIRIGTVGTQTSTFISGIAGITVANKNFVTINTVTGEMGSQSAGGNVVTYTAVNFAASPYTVLATDQYIAVDSSGGAVTLRFPNAPATTGTTWTVKDKTGNALANNITITTPGGVVNFDGATTFVMNVNYQAVNLLWNGASYEIY